ncbi:MAG: DUF5683 domain-containing protein [candidate division KSB1 bacterium]|nr:DUF5683 domain-containing protein [candidate division KSB1 bacterium]
MRETTMPPVQLSQTDASEHAGLKNVKAALFMSAALPGAGQAYAGNWLKAALFAAVEATGWTLYAVYNEKGKDIRSEFHSYAHTHWSESSYWKWVAHQAGLEYNADDLTDLREWEHEHFSHGLHEQKDQQYYEMIGKYHQFNYGWDDFRNEYSITMTHQELNNIETENRHTYESKRNDANQAFRTATSSVTVVMLNHILSAADAAWTAYSFNNRSATLSLKAEPLYFDQDLQTVLSLRVNW